LNTGGVNLKAQEIRASLYHSPLYEMILRVNSNLHWRRIIGLADPDLHMKDAEFLLRCLALLLNHGKYAPSMTRFLNEFSRSGKALKEDKLVYLESLLKSFFEACSGLAPESFRSKSGRFSAAIFESVFVALCESLLPQSELLATAVTQKYVDSLKTDPEFVRASQRRTTDKQNLINRLNRAKTIFFMS
jgi:hypothetical protein